MEMKTYSIGRRNFIQNSLLGAASAALALQGSCVSKDSAPATSLQPVELQLGLASYSLRKFSAIDTMHMCRKAGLPNICLKSMHLPLESDDETIRSTVAMFREGGVNPYACGVVYMNSEAEVEQAFHYASTAGMNVIVGVPAYNLLPMVSQMVSEYDIKLAIHNHGPGDELYPTPESIYQRIADLDQRIGICHDIGHTLRLGIDPTAETRKYFDRIHDVHIKDIDKASPEGDTVEIGRGVIDIPSILDFLAAEQYVGIVSFEYEKDENDPLPGLCESVGYVKGVMRMLNS